MPNIGLVGRKRTGKDTAGGYLQEAHGYRRMAFADKLRAAVEVLDPVVGYLSWTSYREALERYGYEEAKDRFPEFRRVLQAYGTGLRDALGPDVWVDALARELDHHDPAVPVVVTDVRFPNEAARLAGRGFLLVRLTRGEHDGDTHPSETEVDKILTDLDYRNEGSLQDFHRFLDHLVTGDVAVAG